MDIRQQTLRELQERIGGGDPSVLLRLLIAAEFDIDAAIRLYAQESRVKPERKRARDCCRFPPTLPVWIGGVEIEAYALASTRKLHAGLPVSFLFEENRDGNLGKRRKSQEIAVRFRTNRWEDSEYLGRIPRKFAEFLHPLLVSGVIGIEGELGEVPSAVKVSDSLQVSVRISIKSTEIADPLSTREAISRLFAAISLKKLREHAANSVFSLSSALKSTYDKELPESDTVATSQISLFPYQKRALAWMLSRESGEFLESQRMATEYQTETGESVYFNPWTGGISLQSEDAGAVTRGGILADESGLGKTVIICAVLLQPSTFALPAGKKVKSARKTGNTLIVVPTAMVPQWKSQLNTHCPSLSICEFKGNCSDFQSEVVLTTYSVLASDANSKGTLLQVEWNRVVLDDAHAIRNRSSAVSKACFAIPAKIRWAVTATPVVSGIDDLFSLVKFIGLSPWSDFSHWTKHISYWQKQPSVSLFRFLHCVLAPVLLRRSRESELADILPPISIRTKEVYMNDTEKEVYRRVWRDGNAELRAISNRGLAKNCAGTVGEMILRLRLASDHPSLASIPSLSPQKIEAKVSEILEDCSSQFARELTAQLQSGADLECPVCYNSAEDVVLPPCGHYMCRPCAYRQLETNGNCPQCKRELQLPDLQTAPRKSRLLGVCGPASDLSSKLCALLATVRDCDWQIVVMTEFLSMLDLIAGSLLRNGVEFARMEENMNRKQKADAQNSFKSGRKVFLVAMKAVTEADFSPARTLVLFEPWLDRSTERKSIEKLYRIEEQLGKFQEDREEPSHGLSLEQGVDLFTRSEMG